MAKIEIKSQGGSKTYEVDDQLVTIGRDEKNHIRIKDPSAAPFEARLSQDAGKWRVEAPEAGRKITLNGLAVTAGDLEPGDVVKAGAIEIVFHGDEAPVAAAAPEPQRSQPTPKPVLRSGQKAAGAGASAPASPQPLTRSRSGSGSSSRTPSARGGAAARGRGRDDDDDEDDRRGGHRHEPRRNASNSVGLYSIIGLVAIAGVYLVYVVMGSWLAGTPAQALETARGFVRDGHAEEAEQVLDVLEKKGLDASMQAEMAKMRKQIQSLKHKSELSPQIGQAGSEQGAVLSYWTMNLPKEPYERPKARQGILLANNWLERYRNLADADVEFADGMYKDIKDRVKKAEQYAAMGDPDNAEDALYKADYLTRLTRKRWRDAIKALDDYLARDPKNDRVLAMKTTRLNQAKNFLEDKMASATRVIASKDEAVIRDYIEQFEFQVKTGGLPQWEPQLTAKLADLRAALPKK